MGASICREGKKLTLHFSNRLFTSWSRWDRFSNIPVMLDQVHEELDVIGAEWDEEDLPTSVGDYFEHQFDKFLEKEQDKEKKNMKEALFR